jgi:DNA-binding MarR family transcriptional regulator
MISEFVEAIQRYYPQIYGGCHADHVRAKSTPYRLSATDSSLLAHLDRTTPTLAGELALHLGVSASTISAAIKRLTELGYIERAPRAKNKREIELRLTALGSAAMAATSVLDQDRVAAALHLLTAAERKRAVSGLTILARAASKLQLTQPKHRKHL